MQTSADISINPPVVKIENDAVSSTRTFIQTLPTSNTIQTSAVPYSQASSSTSPPTITAARVEKPANGTTAATNNRFVASAPLSITPFHNPRGGATVANISGPKGKVASPIIRASAVSHIQPTTTTSSSTTQGFISSLSRPMTTYVVTTTTTPTVLQKSTTLNVVSSSYVKPSSMMTVTSRIATPVVTKPSEMPLKPLILQNTKQIITQANNQILDRNSGGGLLKTNLGMVTIRGTTTVPPTLQPQSRVSVAASNTQPPRLPVPMLVPTSTAVRKPQTLAPKVITQSTRAPFTVQSIPVSVSHTPSALTMNKKTAGITVGNNQTTISGQSTTAIVRANPTIVAEIRPTTPSTNLLIQATSKPQNTVPSNAGVTAFSAPNKTYMHDAENFQVKRTLVSSSTPAFTSTVSSFSTASMPRHFNVVTPVIPRLNPIMVMEAPRIATTVAPTSPNSIPPPGLTIQQYVIPQGNALAPVQQQFQSQTQPQQQQAQSQHQQQQSSFHAQRMSPGPQPSSTIKPNASPRPSILRKRDIDGCSTKAQRNLTPLLNSASSIPSPPASPHLPDIRDGQSSNSSSTLSATSSPGIPNIDPESPTQKIDRIERTLLNSQNEEEHIRTAASLIEMSPRKKPRKQQLTACTNSEPKMEDDMQFICDDKIKKEPKSSDMLETVCNNQEFPKSSSSSSSSSSKKPNISILTGYNHGWKSRHHHFLRYTDVKYKDEKKPSVSDIANQKYVTQKINGWKIYHLSTQMEDLHDIEIEVVDKLSSLLKLFTHPAEDDDNKSLNRTNELIMGNMQRSKVVSDQLKEAKTQMLKVFNHKKHVSEIINKYASKRTIKKKGRY